MYVIINLSAKEILGTSLSLEGAMRLALSDILYWNGVPSDISFAEGGEEIRVSCNANNIYGEPLEILISKTIMVP